MSRSSGWNPGKEMLDERSPQLPHRWVTADDEPGRASWFRRALRERGEQYLLAVPFTAAIRDLDAPAPEYSGFGSIRKRRFETMRDWRKSLPKSAWTRVEVRDGEKGPLKADIISCRVEARLEKCVGPEELLVVIRRRDEIGKSVYDYHLSNAAPRSQRPIGAAIMCGVALPGHDLPNDVIEPPTRGSAGASPSQETAKCRRVRYIIINRFP